MSLERVRLNTLNDDDARQRTGKQYRFHIAEDVLRAGGARPTSIDSDGLALLYRDVDRVALYVHVPWCVETCTYCYYWGKMEGRSAMQALLNAEAEHARRMDDLIGLAEKETSSIYFGGGTPTVLPPDLLEQAMEAFVGRYGARGTTEVCSEASVSSLTARKIDILQRYVSRLSIGVQSFDDRHLQAVARSFTSDQAQDLLKEVVPRFPLVNIDLIYGFASQTLDDWIRTVEKAIELGVTSITLYRLEIRVSAQLEDFARNAAAYPGDAACRAMRRAAKALLLQSGYRENLVGWFVKPADADTVVYRERWQKQTPCIAFGPGVHNYGPGHFYYNIDGSEEYARSVNAGQLPIGEFHWMGLPEQALWYCLAQLKSKAPILFEDVRSKFGEVASARIIEAFSPLFSSGLFSASHQQCELSEEGSEVLEWLISDLLAAWRTRSAA